MLPDKQAFAEMDLLLLWHSLAPMSAVDLRLDVCLSVNFFSHTAMHAWLCSVEVMHMQNVAKRKPSSCNFGED